MKAADAANITIGKFYWVPCVRILDGQKMILGRLIPIIGPLHEDSEIIEFNFHHWHVDWRFVTQRQWKNAIFARRTPHSIVICDFNIAARPFLRRLKCKRAMPEFPAVKWLIELEQQFQDQTLKPGLVCPHRGMPLSGCPVRPDRTVVCPGHGLAWNIETGKLQTRQLNENRA